MVTPPSFTLPKSGSFTVTYTWPKLASSHAKVSGRVRGKSASGSYAIGYTATRGLTIYACQDKGTWKASTHGVRPRLTTPAHR